MKKMITVVTTMLMTLGAAAQEQPVKSLTLTLEDAITIALDENPTIRVADMEIERQDYVRKETVGNLLPSLSASGQYSYSIVKQKMSKSGLSFGADNTVTVGANLSVPLYVPAVYASLKLNDAQIASAIESARASRINMVNEVRKAYYNILMLEESLRVLRESETLMQETVDNTRMLYEAELASEYDYISAEASLSGIQPTIIQTEGSMDVAKMYMRMLLSLPQDVDIELEGTLDSYYASVDGTEHSTDISGNSDLRSLDIQQMMLEAQLKLVNAQRLPTIAAFGSLSLYGNDMPEINFGGSSMISSMIPDLNLADYPALTGAVAEALGTAGMADLARLIADATSSSSNSSTSTQTENSRKFWWQNPASVGVSVSIPIFSGNKINNQAKQAKIAMNQLSVQRDYLEQSIVLQLQTSLSTLMTARGSMVANEMAVRQAQKAFDISNVRYNGGAGTILELNSAQVQLTQAKLNYTQAIYDYLAAEADYQKIIGADF